MHSADLEKELNILGLRDPMDLFKDIPDKFLLNNLGVGRGIGEFGIYPLIDKVKEKNRKLSIFLGLGIYNRNVPASVMNIIYRNEFITSYTPYQAEISQGMLRTLFEFQSLICDLTSMDVTNSSMYDGPSAIGEACRMAYRINGKEEILVPENIWKNHLDVLNTYITGLPLKIIKYPLGSDGLLDLDKLNSLMGENTCAILTYNPNCYGLIDKNVFKVNEIKKDAIHIAYYDPVSLSIIKSPGEYNADIAVGEGQSLGLPMNFGGPTIGLFSFKNDYIRKSPGRLIGETIDRDGKRAYVMTLQTREQHIRRDKAMSNICTNQALLALGVSVYLGTVGEKGLKYVAEKSIKNVRTAINNVIKDGKFKEIYNSKLFFSDFILKSEEDCWEVFEKLNENSIIGGYPAEYAIGKRESGKSFFACTEKNNDDEMEKLKQALEVI